MIVLAFSFLENPGQRYMHMERGKNVSGTRSGIDFRVTRDSFCRPTCVRIHTCTYISANCCLYGVRMLVPYL